MQNQRSKRPLEQDFRSIPLALPLKSPSPDHKSFNNLTPTRSPNPLHIQKHITPPRIAFSKPAKENFPSFDIPTNTKYNTYSPHLQEGKNSSTHDKDEIIEQLKKIINILTENTRYSRGQGQDKSQLENQIRVLTIENQNLVNIIEKKKVQQGNKALAEETIHQLSSYEKEINDLMETIKMNQNLHQTQMVEVKRLYKNTMNHCKNIQDENRDLQRENEKLIKLLQQEGSRRKAQKMKISDLSEENDGEKTIQKIGNEKLTLVKIKQQYAENLKLLKYNLEQQIYQQQQSNQTSINDLDSKTKAMTKRLQSIEKMIWDQLKSMKMKKSEIYIEQAPSSSSEHQKVSKDELNEVIAETEREGEDFETLRKKLDATEAELGELRFKYEKMCLDTSSIAYSQVIQQQKNEEFERELEQRVSRILVEKDKEINQLYQQIKQYRKYDDLKSEPRDQNNQNIQSIQSFEQIMKQHERKIQSLKEQTETKVTQLIENYEKQLQMFRKQLRIKNSELHQANQTYDIEKVRLAGEIEEMKKKLQAKQEEIEREKTIMCEKLIQEEKKRQNDFIEKQNLRRQAQQMRDKVQIMIEINKDQGQEMGKKILELEKLKALNRDFEQKVAQINQVVQGLEQQKQTLQSDNKKLNNEKYEQKLKTQKAIEKLETLQKLISLNSVKPKIQKILEMISSPDFENQENEMKSELERQREELQYLQASLLKQQEKCFQLETEIFEREKQRIYLQKRIEEMQEIQQQTNSQLLILRQKQLQHLTRINPPQQRQQKTTEQYTSQPSIASSIKQQLLELLSEEQERQTNYDKVISS